MRRRTVMMAAVAGVLGPRARAAAKPVVLELFTSQGCSSCPPADALLGRLAQRPEVIALAWHVDYWNHLGWRDPYASRQATERQKAYSSQLGIDVFTPALVVDGANIVVGSRQREVDAAIAAATGLPVSVTLNWGADGLIADVGGGGRPLRALFAAYDPLHATDVGAGENAGAPAARIPDCPQGRNAGRMGRALRRLVLPTPAPGQGVVVLVQSAELRVVGAADLPPG